MDWLKNLLIPPKIKRSINITLSWHFEFLEIQNIPLEIFKLAFQHGDMQIWQFQYGLLVLLRGQDMILCRVLGFGTMCCMTHSKRLNIVKNNANNVWLSLWDKTDPLLGFSETLGLYGWLFCVQFIDWTFIWLNPPCGVMHRSATRAVTNFTSCFETWHYNPFIFFPVWLSFSQIAK